MPDTEIELELQYLLSLLPADQDEITLYNDFGSDSAFMTAIKAAIYLENQLSQFLDERMVDNSAIERMQLSLSAKLDLAIGLGLRTSLQPPISNVAKVRNNFAHNLHAALGEVEANNLYSAFSSSDKEVIQRTYNKVRGSGNSNRPKKFSSLEPLERFQLMALSLRQALKIERARALAANQTSGIA